jgi:L-seryl-tRNA(Ser) seleniumtransferase
VVIQAGQRYSYDRMPSVAGGVLREVGDAGGTSAAQVEAAIGESTAAVLFPAHLDGQAGTLPFEETAAIAHRKGVPVLVDAAFQVYPVERMRSWTARGADLVGFGAKYFGAPHSSGLLCGRADLVGSAARQGFIAFERQPYRPLGRPFKLDRGEIVAVVVALREWLTLDHGARIARIKGRVDALVGRLAGLPGVVAEGVPEANFGAPGLRLRVDPAGGRGAPELRAALESGSPSIVADAHDGALYFNLSLVAEADDATIADRLREVLGGR